MIEIQRRGEFIYFNEDGKQLARLDLSEAFAFKAALDKELLVLRDAARLLLGDKIKRAEGEVETLRARLAEIEAIETSASAVLRYEQRDQVEAERSDDEIDVPESACADEAGAPAAAPPRRLEDTQPRRMPPPGKPEPPKGAVETLRCEALAVEIGRDTAIVTRGDAHVEVAPRVGRLFYLLGRAFGELVESNFLAREIYSATNSDALQRLSQLAGDATSFAPRLGLTIAYTRPIGWRLKEARK